MGYPKFLKLLSEITGPQLDYSYLTRFQLKEIWQERYAKSFTEVPSPTLKLSVLDYEKVPGTMGCYGFFDIAKGKYFRIGQSTWLYDRVKQYLGGHDYDSRYTQGMFRVVNRVKKLFPNVEVHVWVEISFYDLEEFLIFELQPELNVLGKLRA